MYRDLPDGSHTRRQRSIHAPDVTAASLSETGAIAKAEVLSRELVLRLVLFPVFYFSLDKQAQTHAARSQTRAWEVSPMMVPCCVSDDLCSHHQWGRSLIGAFNPAGGCGAESPLIATLQSC